MAPKGHRWPVREGLPNEREFSTVLVETDDEPTEIAGPRHMQSVAFLANRGYVVTGEQSGKIRCWWRVDGNEVGTPMDAENSVLSLAVSSEDGKWIVAGTQSGQVMVWDAETREKVNEFKPHSKWEEVMGNVAVRAVDISPRGTRIVTGSSSIVRVWSRSTGCNRVLNLKLPKISFSRTSTRCTVKYSPNGRLLAVARFADSVSSDSDPADLRVYDSWENGHLLVNIRIHLKSLAWASDNERFFALSRDGTICHLDASSGTMISQWPSHSNDKPTCIALSSDGTLVAASTYSSVSLWDVATCQQVGSVIHHSPHIHTMTFSGDCLMIGGRKRITLRTVLTITAPRVDRRVSASQDEHSVDESFAGHENAIQDINVNPCSDENISDLELASLNEEDHLDAVVERSKAETTLEPWEDALNTADEVIDLEPLYYLGYEQRHAVLHGVGRYEEAVVAFDMMLSTLDQSPDHYIRELRSGYSDARPLIRDITRTVISEMPRVLIDTTTGHLHDRMQQAEAFEELPIFSELVSSMTREVDLEWIQREVKGFYRYVMFSHRWEHGEPLSQEVERVTVYRLEASRANNKLQRFCTLARSLGFRWAWSDTCCIDRENHVVLQESLVAMFMWYRCSSLTLIYLLGVSSRSEEPYGLRGSIWNTRVWTYQEYVAAKRVQFYTEDWKPYLGLTLSNHKNSPAIRKEMGVSEVSAEQLDNLEPGLDRVREKLHLASMRQTTLVEDIAYSLLGIFKASIPVIYGEGRRAVGRLLEHVLTGSGDATILAWTGVANDYHSCLPMDLTVYSTLVPQHIPRMETAELDQVVEELYSLLPDLSLASTLYDLLHELPPPSLASSRLQLPGIVSPVTHVVQMAGPNPSTYRVSSRMLGDIEIETGINLAKTNGLCLVHPWVRPLLDQEFLRGPAGLDRMTQALRIAVRLRQPFGALLFEQVSRVDYRRIAADCLIMVRFRDGLPLTDLIQNVRTIEVQ